MKVKINITPRNLRWLQERAAANECTIDELLDTLLIAVEDFERWRREPLFTRVRRPSKKVKEAAATH
jgi:hypothetical protein